MATVRDIIHRSLRRIGVIDAVVNVAAAEDVSAGLDALNEMVDGWVHSAVDCKFRSQFAGGFALADTFWLFIPHASATDSTIVAMDYQGTWDATANSPTLAGSEGTEGHFYRVETAGTTSLDDLDSWVVDDALIFDGTVWRKARSSKGYEGGIIAMLALRLAPEYGIEPTAQLQADANNGWIALQAAYVKPADGIYDRALVQTTRRAMWWY